MMTDKEYLKSGGNKCPICGSDNISADGTFESDGTRAWQRVTCNLCTSDWDDVYELKGFDCPNDRRSEVQLRCNDCGATGELPEFERQFGASKCPDCNSGNLSMADECEECGVQGELQDRTNDSGSKVRVCCECADTIDAKDEKRGTL